jgi:hypothetical protein
MRAGLTASSPEGVVRVCPSEGDKLVVCQIKIVDG